MIASGQQWSGDMGSDPTEITDQLSASAWELRKACKKARDTLRLRSHASGDLDQLLTRRAGEGLNRSRELLAKTERPARQSQ